MSPNDPSSDLDSRIAAIVESTVGRMRDELLHRVQDTETRLRDITGRLSDQSPAPSPAEPEPRPATAAGGGPEIGELFDAVVAIDRGGSQQEVLAALLEGVGRFASRCALFLTRADGAQGWGSFGFEESAAEIQEVRLSYAEGPLAVLSEGRGCVSLETRECAEICERMGVAPGAEGLLVPFVLRDRVAATLYVDRRAEDGPLDRRSLQLLTYIGAQAVEGLAVRQREETPTLQIASEQPAAPGVALWEEAGKTAQEPEPGIAAPAESAPAEAPPSTESAFAAPPVAAPPISDTQLSEPTLPEPALTPVQPAPPPADDDVLPDASRDDLVEPEDAATTIIEELPTIDLETPDDDEWTVPLAEPATEPEPVAQPTPGAPASAEEPILVAPAEPAQQPAATTVEPPAAPVPTVDVAEGGGESTEVRPPTDVSGPGWAFTASRAAAESGDEAQHEEARRLARLLVTEIKLYNEEQVEEGRRGNDIYPRLREDIDRSRQIFNERVDDAVRQEADYFQEEMVRILAGGNAEALGL